MAQSQSKLSPFSSTIAGIENLNAFGANVASFLSSHDTVENSAKFAQFINFKSGNLKYKWGYNS